MNSNRVLPKRVKKKKKKGAKNAKRRRSKRGSKHTLRSDFAPTIKIFCANGSSNCCPVYNGNPISVHSQTEFQTCYKMPNWNFQVYERAKEYFVIY